MSELDRRGVELAWARATPLLKEHLGVHGTSMMVTAIITLLAEPIISAYLSVSHVGPNGTAQGITLEELKEAARSQGLEQG